MKLSTLILDAQYQVLQGSLRKVIHGIAYHHVKVSTDYLFIAIPGFSVDGHTYVQNAIEQGASTIIVEKDLPHQVDKSITVLKVSDARNALAHIAATFYNYPSEKINLIGITGTNGKTSITYFLNSIYEQAQQTVGMIGTTGLKINDQFIPVNTSTPTTPESLDLQKLFHHMVDLRIDNCIMEVSSHALHLKRVAHTTFQTGIYTNLSPDHMELHKNMDDYFTAKAKLFTLTKKHNIINIDDLYGKKLAGIVQDEQAKIVTYGIHHEADIMATNINYSFNQTTYTVQTPTEKTEITVHLPGEIYVYNSLAAIAAAYYDGISLNIISKGVNAVNHIDGRFEVIYEQDDFKVIIDFAHTEDALAQTLKSVRPYVKGKLILVFGVYADMSVSGQNKRTNMGKVAAQHADYSIVTLDNPKYFDQQLIIREICESIEKHHGNYEAILDREQAIQAAISISENNDIIVIAGKGHETTQVIQGEEIPLNEKVIVLEALAEKVI